MRIEQYPVCPEWHCDRGEIKARLREEKLCPAFGKGDINEELWSIDNELVLSQEFWLMKTCSKVKKALVQFCLKPNL